MRGLLPSPPSGGRRSGARLAECRWCSRGFPASPPRPRRASSSRSGGPPPRTRPWGGRPGQRAPLPGDDGYAEPRDPLSPRLGRLLASRGTLQGDGPLRRNAALRQKGVAAPILSQHPPTLGAWPTGVRSNGPMPHGILSRAANVLRQDVTTATPWPWHSGLRPWETRVISKMVVPAVVVPVSASSFIVTCSMFQGAGDVLARFSLTR